MRVTRFLRSAAATLVAALPALAGCTASRDDPPTLLQVQDDGVVFLALAVPPEAVMDALFEGRVAMDDAGCLRLDSADPSTVVWPYGSTLVRRGGDRAVVDGHGREIGRIGGSFRFGGGHVPFLHEGIALPAEARRRAEARCPGGFWIVGEVP